MPANEYNKLAFRFHQNLSRLSLAFLVDAVNTTLDYIHTFHYIHSVEHLAKNYKAELENLAHDLGHPLCKKGAHDETSENP